MPWLELATIQTTYANDAQRASQTPRSVTDLEASLATALLVGPIRGRNQRSSPHEPIVSTRHTYFCPDREVYPGLRGRGYNAGQETNRIYILEVCIRETRAYIPSQEYITYSSSSRPLGVNAETFTFLRSGHLPHADQAGAASYSQ